MANARALGVLLVQDWALSIILRHFDSKLAVKLTGVVVLSPPSQRESKYTIPTL